MNELLGLVQVRSRGIRFSLPAFGNCQSQCWELTVVCDIEGKGEYETNEIDETNEEILNFFRLVRLFRLVRILSSDLAMSLPWLNVGLPQIWVLLKTGKYRMITPTQLENYLPQ
jgi:hypothetical protein